MEILTPLSKLLQWERSTDLSPSSRKEGGQFSSSRADAAPRSPDISARSIFRHLYALPPRELQRVVAQHLPFLNDPYFSQRLSRATVSVNAQGGDEGGGGERISDSHLVRDKAGGFWKVWVLPVALEGRLAKVTLYLSKRRPKNNRDKNNNRLILATELDHTGPLEIEADIFDTSLLLAVRSTRSFSALAEQGIRERFLQILDVVRMQGSINFYTVSSLSMDALSSQPVWEVEL